MSQAFIKEEDGQWLHDIAPTLTALISFLSKENNGIRVYEKGTSVKAGKEIFHMSNGIDYFIGDNGRWEMA